jgi:hypothetical protein
MAIISVRTADAAAAETRTVRTGRGLMAVISPGDEHNEFGGMRIEISVRKYDH